MEISISENQVHGWNFKKFENSQFKFLIKISFYKASFYYEVKFSKDFNFVKGGKIPGFYGGKMGCNGGADAAKEGCFSSNN